MSRGTIRIDVDHCKGCTLCVSACPQEVIVINTEQVNGHGYHPAQLKEEAKHCTGCGICALFCPDACISVYREPMLHSAKEVGVWHGN